jgi:hypothetical protein
MRVNNFNDMKKTFIIFSILIASAEVFCQTTFATPDTNYIKLVEKAFDYLKKGACQPCLDTYEEAFKISQRSVLSRLRAAACAFDCKNDTKWRYHLNFAIEKDWGAAESILQDADNQYPELRAHKGDELYNTALSQIKEIKKKTGYDEVLAAELEIIQRDDQFLRQQLSDINTEEERTNTWKKIIESDSINLVKIEKIFATHGYPGKSKVGGLSSTAFLVIQHSDLYYQEKYFPLLEKAANENELDKSSLALLIDRIRMRKGQNQLYGSQVVDNDRDGKWELFPVEDEENLNKRRSEMGLGPIEEYAKRFNIDYKFVKKE